MIKLLKHQIEPTAQLEEFLLSSKKGVLLIGQPGCGKTYIMAEAIRRVQARGKLLRDDDKPFMLAPCVVLAPTNCIIQHQRVFVKTGIKNTEIITGNSLGATAGELWIEWIDKMIRGELDTIPVWRPDFMPEAILVDECQQYKNRGATRTKCLQAYVDAGGKLAFISATPFQKACEAELILNACHITNKHGFNDYANNVSNGEPTGNSPIAVRRIKEDLEERECLINISNVRYPFKPVVKNYLFDVADWKKKLIDQAYDEYLEIRAKMGKPGTPQGVRAIWVAQNKFREKSELLKSDEIAELAKNIHLNQNRAVIIASNFIPTLIKAWEELVKAGIKPGAISSLVGSQNAKQKQQNIDDFQEGKTQFFLTTLKSGGTGLNLHHEVPTSLPRTIILPPTWSIYEMFQCLFRTQRINNLSASNQYICWYKGTIEEKVAARLESKYSCLKELLDRKDDFIASIFDGAVDEYIKSEFEKQVLAGDGEASENEGETVESMFDSAMLDGEQ